MKVLIVGASGFMGQKITSTFLNTPQVETKLLVRKGSEEKVKHFIEKGAHLIEGDILNSSVEELAHAMEGVQVVVSAVSGVAELKIVGQEKLLKAAKIAGVQKIVPSSFGYDQDTFESGICFLGDPVKKFNEILRAQSDVDYLIVNNEFDPNIKLQLTSPSDVARYIVEVSLNQNLRNRVLNIYAEELTMKQVIELVHGPNVQIKQLGTASDFQEILNEQLKTTGVDLPFLFGQLKYLAVSGIANIHDNQDLSHLNPLSLKTYLQFIQKQ